MEPPATDRLPTELEAILGLQCLGADDEVSPVAAAAELDAPSDPHNASAAASPLSSPERKELDELRQKEEERCADLVQPSDNLAECTTPEERLTVIEKKAPDESHKGGQAGATPKGGGKGASVGEGEVEGEGGGGAGAIGPTTETLDTPKYALIFFNIT